MAKHPPKKLQVYLWSVDTSNLDINKDKIYIIHQLFNYGSFEEWRWLFKTYGFLTLVNVFLKHPMKIYFPKRFNFIKNIILNLKNRKLVKEYYVINTPRIIRRKKEIGN